MKSTSSKMKKNQYDFQGQGLFITKHPISICFCSNWHLCTSFRSDKQNKDDYQVDSMEPKKVASLSTAKNSMWMCSIFVAMEYSSIRCRVFLSLLILELPRTLFTNWIIHFGKKRILYVMFENFQKGSGLRPSEFFGKRTRKGLWKILKWLETSIISNIGLKWKLILHSDEW